jgi:UDP-N-acetylmuramoylalanine--D-glutamate ligase
LEAGGHNRETFLNAELIILSPGVPNDMALLVAARKRDIPVIGELELASRLIDTPIIAVTGTNGKSTGTAFLGDMLEKAGFEVFVGGNIGTPLMVYAEGEGTADYVVVEVSSFQLDTVETFCPFVSIILNISPDHLDRYPNYEAYVQSKLKIFKNQGPGQYVILNDSDERLCSVNPTSGVSIFRYGTKEKEGRHAFIQDTKIRASIDSNQIDYFSFESFGLPGKHNLENCLALVLVGRTLGIDRVVIQKSIDEFKGLPHRLELVGESGGVSFYNDSKATNVDAAIKAVTSFDRTLILIAGGRHKGADYTPLVRAAEGRVKKAIFLGEARDLLAGSFGGIIPFSIAENMEEAVSKAFSWAKSGDVVLLAPACSSFDMFSDYSHRGEVFRAAVERTVHG